MAENFFRKSHLCLHGKISLSQLAKCLYRSWNFNKSSVEFRRDT